MKRIMQVMLVAIVVTAGSLKVSAQDGYMYARFGLGWDLRNASSTMVNTTSTTSSTTYETQQFSAGAGIPIEGAFGMMFNKNFGAELGLNYLIGMPGTFKSTDKGGTITQDVFSSGSFRIMPSAVVSAGMDGLNPYARFGFVIGVANSVTDDMTVTGAGANNEEITKYSGGIALGVTGAVGVSLPLGDKLKFYAELTSINMQYTPSSSEITKATANGQDQLSSMTTYQKQTTYSSSVTSPTSTPDPNTAKTETSTSIPFSSLGFHVGIAMKF